MPHRPFRFARLVALVTVLMLAISLARPAAAQQEQPLILGVTLDLQKTGLLDVLVPAFEQHAGRPVTVVAVSAPHALVLGIRAEIDVLLVDAGDDEPSFVSAGHGVERALVMHADEVIVGPRNDPARVQQAANVTEGLRRIIETGNDWVSRADNSALFQVEKRLWGEAGIEPRGQAWYVPFGQGMIATLAATSERQAYTLADRATFLEREDTLDLAIQFAGDPELLRLYHVIVVNPAKGDWIDDAGARQFAQFVLSPEAQEMIGSYGVARFGQPIFTPDAGRTEQDLRPGRQQGR